VARDHQVQQEQQDQGQQEEAADGDEVVALAPRGVGFREARRRTSEVLKLGHQQNRAVGHNNARLTLTPKRRQGEHRSKLKLVCLEVI